MVTANYRIVDFVNNLKNMDKLGGTDQRTKSAVHGSRSFCNVLLYIGQKLKKIFFEKYRRYRRYNGTNCIKVFIYINIFVA